MSTLAGATLAEAGVDAVALKPTEMALSRARALSVETLTIDYEGTEHVPDPETLSALAQSRAVRVTVPVRADGFDPQGDEHLLAGLSKDVGRVLVAGHPAYLDPHEKRRSVAPRLRAAADRASDPWVGTENVERIALAVGGTQFDLLSGSTRRDVGSLRAAGFEGDVAVYAPIVLSDEDDAILDAVGDYAARRADVREDLPDDAPTDSRVSGRARETLMSGCRQYALVGDFETVAGRIDRLHELGVDHVVAYPARGLDPFVG
ncbi:MAG: hypothetical protein ACI8XM_001453 [Haloarculaceae archaeon]|jgi:hypothetical protein